MSISNLLSSNELDLKCGSLTASSSVNVGSVPLSHYSYDFVQANSGSEIVSINTAPDPSNPSGWDVADTLFSATNGPYNIDLDDTYNANIKVTISLINSSGTTPYGGAVALQFQNASDDTWNTDLENLPYQWYGLRTQETGSITLCHKLSAGHGFKSVRVLVASESAGIDIRYGYGSIQQQSYCLLERTYSL